MSGWAAWNVSMICWETSLEEPGLFDHQVICAAGFTPL
jgi:hypothetical protein